MSYSLRANLHYCVCEGRVVILDVLANRYIALSKSLGDRFTQLASRNALDPAEETELQPLFAKGWLIRSESASQLPRPPTLARARFEAAVSAQPNAINLAGALREALAAEIWLKTATFSSIIERLTADRSRIQIRSDVENECEKATAAMEAINRLLGSHDRCLQRSIALARICHGKSVPADLVLGVRLDPFTAHAWVQYEDRVLCDSSERTELFTPILVTR